MLKNKSYERQLPGNERNAVNQGGNSNFRWEIPVTFSLFHVTDVLTPLKTTAQYYDDGKSRRKTKKSRVARLWVL